MRTRSAVSRACSSTAESDARLSVAEFLRNALTLNLLVLLWEPPVGCEPDPLLFCEREECEFAAALFVLRLGVLTAPPVRPALLVLMELFLGRLLEVGSGCMCSFPGIPADGLVLLVPDLGGGGGGGGGGRAGGFCSTGSGAFQPAQPER